MSFSFDFWTIWGLLAQGLFFSRFIVQWYFSEKRGEISIPLSFWVISLAGAIMIFVYAIARLDFVFFVAGLLQILLYSRSLFIARNKKKININD